MADSKMVKELMIDAFEYPHMPYWFTIRQAVGIMKKTAIDAQKSVQPQVILVFDEAYNLIGTLNIRDILGGVVPGLLAHGSTGDAEATPAAENVIDSADPGLSRAEVKKLSERPISDIMKPVSISVAPEDSVAKAASLMHRGNLQVLPVLENKKRLVGIVRMIEVFREVSDLILGK
jgi:CBS domain-containing protein